MTLILPAAVASKLRLHSQVRNAFGGGFAQVLNPSEQELATAFGVRNVHLVNGVYNSANPGATVSMADIFGKHAWLVHLPSGGLLSRRQRSAWANFMVVDPAMPQDDDFISYEMIERDSSEGKFLKSRWVTATQTYKFKVLENTMCYFIEDAVA